MYRGHFGACKKWGVFSLIIQHRSYWSNPGVLEGVYVIAGCPQGESWLYFYFMLYSYEFVYNIFRDCSGSSMSIVDIPERTYPLCRGILQKYPPKFLAFWYDTYKINRRCRTFSDFPRGVTKHLKHSRKMWPAQNFKIWTADGVWKSATTWKSVKLGRVRCESVNYR